MRYLTINEYIDRVPFHISRPTVYARIKDGSLPSVKFGGKRLIPESATDLPLSTDLIDSVTKSRTDQGLPPTIEDRGTLERVADLVRDGGQR